MSVRAVLGALQAVAARRWSASFRREFGVEWIPRADGRGNEIRGVDAGSAGRLFHADGASTREGTQTRAAWERKHGRAPTSRGCCTSPTPPPAIPQGQRGRARVDWDALARQWTFYPRRRTGRDSARGVGRAPPRGTRGEHHAAGRRPDRRRARPRHGCIGQGPGSGVGPHGGLDPARPLKQLALVLPAETRQMSPEEAQELLFGLAGGAVRQGREV